VQVTVGQDTTQATTAINNFVSAYNAVVANLNTQFTVDPTTNTQGPLAADTSLRALQSTLLSDVTYSITGNSGVVNLASLGIDLNSDGTLTVNQSPTYDSSGDLIEPSLANVLASNPSAVQNFFQNASSTGFGNILANDLQGLTDPTNGILNVDIAGNQTQQTALTTQIATLQDRVTAQQASLTLEYDSVNATLESYPILLQEVKAEIAAINGNTVAQPNTIPVNTTPTTGIPTG
jgi:flagellar hook-associated protein 2